MQNKGTATMIDRVKSECVTVKPKMMRMRYLAVSATPFFEGYRSLARSIFIVEYPSDKKSPKAAKRKAQRAK
jgi:hypothetical protein